MGERICCPTSPKSPTTSALSASIHTEAINHDPALTFFQTGAQQGNRPSMGSWLSYGLGSENKNLPAFCVLLSRGIGNGQGVYSKLWTNGFLDSVHQGVQFSSGEDPVLYLNNPAGWTWPSAAKCSIIWPHLTMFPTTNSVILKSAAKIQAVRNGLPDADRRAGNDRSVHKNRIDIVKLYGPEVPGAGYLRGQLSAGQKTVRKRRAFRAALPPGLGSARRPARRNHRSQAKDVDQASAALVTDLKQRGLLDETLVIWGGEFGRTSYCQGKLTADNYGRDHHPRCFTIWMAGGGIKPGLVYGETDELGYNIARNPVHVHDFQATVLHQLGLNHEKLIFKHLGRRYRLTDVSGKVVRDILS